jgi:hypothetical protein
MALWPAFTPLNDLPEQAKHISQFQESPTGVGEGLQTLGGQAPVGGTTFPGGAIQSALMMPVVVQQPWTPIAIDWTATGASATSPTTTAIAYNWIITDVNGKVVGTTPIATTAVAVGLMTQTVTISGSSLPPGLYYYGFSYTDSPGTSTTKMDVFTMTTAVQSKYRALGCKMWTYLGAGAQIPSTMTLGAACTLLVPTTTCVFAYLNSTIRCMAGT